MCTRNCSVGKGGKDEEFGVWYIQRVLFILVFFLVFVVRKKDIDDIDNTAMVLMNGY